MIFEEMIGIYAQIPTVVVEVDSGQPTAKHIAAHVLVVGLGGIASAAGDKGVNHTAQAALVMISQEIAVYLNL